MKIIKRDGHTQNFDKNKIKMAIKGAFSDLPNGELNATESVLNDLTDKVVSQLDKRKNYNVEQIQDIVELTLMKENYLDVAKAYIEYRQLHKLARNRYSEMMDIVKEKIEAKNVQNQNANVDEHSFGGRLGEMSSAILRQYALENIMSETSKNNHLNNMIYIHDLDHYALGDHNCFQRDTRFITSSGIKSFKDFIDGEETQVLSSDGKWHSATVRCYGRKPMQKVTLERCGKVIDVNCTSDHRWILKDGSVTTDLKVGDVLLPLKDSTAFKVDSKRCAEMFCLGFVIGDGCDHIVHGNLNIQALLCGNKMMYADVFRQAGYREQVSKVENSLCFIKRASIGKQEFLTSRMWEILSFEDKRALFNGYMAADGSQTTDVRYVWTSDNRVLDMIKDLSALSGYHIFKIREHNNSTNYKENRLLYEIVLTFKYSVNTAWCVKGIKAQKNKDYEAWCVEEPVTHSFTLENGIVTGNCLSIPFDKLLANGFKTRQTDVRPAGSINTAMQLVAVIFQLQSLQQFGGVSATHLDWTMVPYVRKSFYKHYRDGLKWFGNADYIDKVSDDLSIDDALYKANMKPYEYALEMTERETHQAVEALYHNLNTLQSRSGNQLPFTSINYGTCTLPEGRLITKELLEVSIEGLGKYHRTSIFPCGIFQCMKGVNREKGDPNYDLFRLALKSTSLRLYPNYANCDWSNNAGYDKNDPKTYFSTMGCRTANGVDINAEPGVNPQTKDGRGNICPVTIIMPTLAMEAVKGKPESAIEQFFRLLDQKIHEAKDTLIERFEYICSQSSKAASFMYDNGTMEWYHPEEGIRSALKHGTIVIGQLGLAETLQILIGKDHTTKEGMELAKRIEQLFKDRCAEFKKEYKLNFGVYYTPAENLCKTAMIKFKDKYGIIPKVSDKKYFTNSMHVPVYHKLNAFEKIDIESELTGYSNAGCITYVELDSSSVHNIDAIEKIVNYAMDKDIPYFAINVIVDTCEDCGYQGEMNDVCPQCGSKNISRLRRVTGYLTGDYKTAFNEGKQQEVEMRVKHTGVEIE